MATSKLAIYVLLLAPSAIMCQITITAAIDGEPNDCDDDAEYCPGETPEWKGNFEVMDEEFNGFDDFNVENCQICEIPDDADLCPGWRFVLNLNEHEQYDPESYYYDQMYDVVQAPEIDGDEINGEDWQDASCEWVQELHSNFKDIAEESPMFMQGSVFASASIFYDDDYEIEDRQDNQMCEDLEKDKVCSDLARFYAGVGDTRCSLSGMKSGHFGSIVCRDRCEVETRACYHEDTDTEELDLFVEATCAPCPTDHCLPLPGNYILGEQAAIATGVLFGFFFLVISILGCVCFGKKGVCWACRDCKYMMSCKWCCPSKGGDEGTAVATQPAASSTSVAVSITSVSQEVSNWITSIGISGDPAAVVREQCVSWGVENVSDLKQLSNDDLNEIDGKIPMVPLKKFKAAVKKIP